MSLISCSFLDATLLSLNMLYASPEEIHDSLLEESEEIHVARVLRERDHEVEEKDHVLETSKKRIVNLEKQLDNDVALLSFGVLYASNEESRDSLHEESEEIHVAPVLREKDHEDVALLSFGMLYASNEESHDSLHEEIEEIHADVMSLMLCNSHDVALLSFGVLYTSNEESHDSLHEESEEIPTVPVLMALIRERDHELEGRDRELETLKNRDAALLSLGVLYTSPEESEEHRAQTA
ncbi:hypothetical protein ACE6H2_021927 [Prunus campanulata]